MKVFRRLPPVELMRDIYAERQFGLVVRGQAMRAPILGLIAIRCSRQGERIVPMTLSIPSTPPAQELPVQSNPRRRWWREDDGA